MLKKKQLRKYEVIQDGDKIKFITLKSLVLYKRTCNIFYK